MDQHDHSHRITETGSSGHEMHGHDHHGMMIKDFKKRFFVCLVITIPVLTLSPMIQEIFRFNFSFSFDKYLLFIFSTIIFLYGGSPFLKGLSKELKEKQPGMMTLIAIAITVAYTYSSAVVFGLKGMDFFWELATLIDVMLLGHWMEMKSVRAASKSLELLVQLLPSEAHMFHGDHLINVKLSELKANDLILVKPGEKIPADGDLIENEGYVNESMLTGESKPVLKKPGDKMIGGSINGEGSFKIRVSTTGKDSYISKVILLVQEAQKTKSRTQRLADRAAFWLTIFAIGFGTATFLIWFIAGKELSFSLERMVTVMVISCPHALGLAIPLVISISSALSARNGLLIRNRTAFENARKITTMVFDKTGTLTEGKFGVTRYKSVSAEFNDEDVLRYAASLETNSEHPIAGGIIEEAKKRKINLFNALNFSAMKGKGIKASIENKEIMVVSPAYLKENKMNLPGDTGSGAAETIVCLIIDNKTAGYIALADKIRPESKTAVKTLQRSGIKTIMLTGDNQAVAESVSKELQLDGYYAEVLPEQKLEKIKDLQNKGEFVAMTGDGINDAPALAQADIGIAIGSGTDIAAETADIILVKSNPDDIASLILFGKATYKKMVQNLVWATAYNVITMPLATGFISGIIISPAIGALFMSLSTIIVAINANLLKVKFSDKTGINFRH